MIYRWTMWFTENEDELQCSLAVLDPMTWDVLAEFTHPCGPFNPLDQVRAQLSDDMRRWLLSCGHQLELEL